MIGLIGGAPQLESKHSSDLKHTNYWMIPYILQENVYYGYYIAV